MLWSDFTPTDVAQGAAMLALVGVVVVLLVVWSHGRAQALLRGWAERNGYRLLHQECRYFFKGPFFWTSGRNQVVYRVTVEDAAGRRSGFVRVGGWFFGLLSDQVEVRWDDDR